MYGRGGLVVRNTLPQGVAFKNKKKVRVLDRGKSRIKAAKGEEALTFNFLKWTSSVLTFSDQLLNSLI